VTLTYRTSRSQIGGLLDELMMTGFCWLRLRWVRWRVAGEPNTGYHWTDKRTSKGTIVTGTPDSKTALAASGSVCGGARAVSGGIYLVRRL